MGVTRVNCFVLMTSGVLCGAKGNRAARINLRIGPRAQPVLRWGLTRSRNPLDFAPGVKGVSYLPPVCDGGSLVPVEGAAGTRPVWIEVCALRKYRSGAARISIMATKGLE